MLGHEKFEAYQISIRFLKLALSLVDNMPSGYYVIKDQFKRASLSVPLNIAEGSGKIKETDKKHYYSISRGSAMECAAICDVLLLIPHEDTQKVNEAKKMLVSLVRILSRVCLG